MAKLNGSIYLTLSQAKGIIKGKKVRILREGKHITIALKTKPNKKMKILMQIKKLKLKLKRMEA